MKNPLKRNKPAQEPTPEPELDFSGYDDNIDYSQEPVDAVPAPQAAVEFEAGVRLCGLIPVPDERAARILRNRLEEWTETLHSLTQMIVDNAIAQAKHDYEEGAVR